jgi:hypothetical protein
MFQRGYPNHVLTLLQDVENYHKLKKIMPLFIMQSNIYLINYKTSYMHYSELPFNFGLLVIYTYILLTCQSGIIWYSTSGNNSLTTPPTCFHMPSNLKRSTFTIFSIEVKTFKSNHGHLANNPTSFQPKVVL